MPFTHQINTTYRTPAGTVVNETENINGSSAGVDIDATIEAGVQQKFDCMICPELIQSMMLWCDQPATVTTQDAQAPTDTISLKAHVPLTWTINSYSPVPFSPGDVHELFVVNNGPATASFKARFLSNSTSA